MGGRKTACAVQVGRREGRGTASLAMKKTQTKTCPPNEKSKKEATCLKKNRKRGKKRTIVPFGRGERHSFNGMTKKKNSDFLRQ